MAFKPYTGDVVPLTDEKKFTPYSGDIIPLDDNQTTDEPAQDGWVSAPEAGPGERYTQGVPTGGLASQGSVNDYNREVEVPFTDEKGRDNEFINPTTAMANAKNTLDRNQVAQKTGEDLAVPGSQMYADVPEERQQELYDMYKNDPKSKMTPTGLSYKGTLVTPPVHSAIDDIPVLGTANKALNRVGFNAAQSAVEMGRNAAISGAAIGDELVQAAGNTPVLTMGDKTIIPALGGGNVKNPEMAKTLDEWLASYNPQGMVDQVISEGTKGALASALAASIGPNNKNVRTHADGTATGTGSFKGNLLKSEAIYAAGADPEMSTGLATGAMDFSGASKALGLNDKDFDEVLAKKKIGILAEGLVGSGVMEGVIKGARATGRFGNKVFVEPIMVLFKDSALQNKTTDTLMKAVSGITNKSSPQEIQAARENIHKYLSDPQNREEVIQTGIQGLDDVTVPNTSMQAIEKGAKGSGDQAVAKNALDTELALGSMDSPKSRDVLANQDTVTDTQLRNAEELRHGGEGTRAQTVGAVTDQTGRDIQNEADYVTNMEKNIEGRKGTLSDVVGPNNKFKEPLQRVEGDAATNKVDSTEFTRGKRAQIGDDLVGIEKDMAKEENNRYTSFVNSLGDTKPNPQFKKAFTEAQPYLSPSVKNINPDEITYAEVYKSIKPELNKRIKSARNAGDIDRAEALEALQSNINSTQLEWMKGSSTSSKQPMDASILMGDEARRYSRDEYQSIWNRGGGSPLGKIRKYSDELIKPYEGSPEAGLAGKAQAKSQIGKQVDTMVNEKGGNFMPVLLDTLKRGEPGAEDNVADYMIGSTAEKILDLNRAAGDINDVHIKNVIKSFQKTIASWPDTLKADGQEFIDNFAKKQGNIKDLNFYLEGLKTNAQGVQERYKGQALKAFFDKDPITAKYNPSSKTPTMVLDDIVNSPSAEQDISQVIDSINRSGDPMALEGLKSAWYRNFRKNVVNNGGGLDTKAVNIDPRTGDVGLNDDKMINAGKLIFGDDPLLQADQEIVEKFAGRKQVREEAYAQKNNNMNPQAVKDESGNAVTRIVNFVFGTLNRTGSSVKTSANILGDRFDKRDAYMALMDEFNANPELFRDAVKKQMEDSNYLLSQDAEDMALKFLSKGIYGTNQDDEMHRMAIMEQQLEEKNSNKK